MAAQLDLAENDVLGYYQSGSKTFRLLDHVPELEVRSVMAHELTHALEDQHHDLEALQKRATNEDQAVAIRSVIEGSAMVTTLAMMNRQGGIGKAKEEAAKTSQEQAKKVQGAPTFVQMRLLMPYTLGFSFLLRGKPWEWLYDGVRIEDIEQAYAQPPHSTREILHPEQYWGVRREAARSLALPDLSKALGPGWSQALTGSIGELGLTLLTGSQLKPDSYEILLPTRWITTGATGNAGELYHHYVNGDRKVTLLLTRWETLRDADEFQRSLRGANKKLYRLGANMIVLAGDIRRPGRGRRGRGRPQPSLLGRELKRAWPKPRRSRPRSSAPSPAPACAVLSCSADARAAARRLSFGPPWRNPVARPSGARPSISLTTWWRPSARAGTRPIAPAWPRTIVPCASSTSRTCATGRTPARRCATCSSAWPATARSS